MPVPCLGELSIERNCGIAYYQFAIYAWKNKIDSKTFDIHGIRRGEKPKLGTSRGIKTLEYAVWFLLDSKLWYSIRGVEVLLNDVVYKYISIYSAAVDCYFRIDIPCFQTREDSKAI